MKRSWAIGYVSVLAASFLLAMLVAVWLGTAIDEDAYDWMFRHHPAAAGASESILLAVDEQSLMDPNRLPGLRGLLAEGLERLAAARPKAVAVDVILADQGDPVQDAALEAAFRKLPNLVLACDMIDDGRRWEDALPRFRKLAAAAGHVHVDPTTGGVTRLAPLEKVAGRDRRWALALEAYRLSRGVKEIVESPGDLQVGALTIPARWDESRAIRIRYRAQPTERVTFWELKSHPELAQRLRNRVVFVGVTAQSAAPDRHITPLSDARKIAGVEIHASIFDTLAGGRILSSASHLQVAGWCFLLALAGVGAFAFRSGWQAYALAALILLAAHLGPYWLFTRDVVFPYFAAVSAAWLSTVGAGVFQGLIVRRQLRRSEAQTARYQQAVHFVTHEMRTPLTAIQGSSELMTRYSLSEEKRKQIADLINSESKRLARMIETFLNVERLSAGELELKRESFAVRQVLEACLGRARPLAERKQIRFEVGEVADAVLTGDRELMEYAIYNLLTNAVKYSPAQTVVSIEGRADGQHLRLAVRDQGIGMEQHELRKIFQKFYRTGRAVESGEAGTGIGLSIVEQIVLHHGGRIEVTSAPGKGSCFTLVLPGKQIGGRI